MLITYMKLIHKMPLFICFCKSWTNKRIKDTSKENVDFSIEVIYSYDRVQDIYQILINISIYFVYSTISLGSHMLNIQLFAYLVTVLDTTTILVTIFLVCLCSRHNIIRAVFGPYLVSCKKCCVPSVSPSRVRWRCIWVHAMYIHSHQT